MEILFICSSLEVGRDGVGDYTRRLSGELIRQGYRASIIALNDKYFKGIEASIQKDDDNEILVLRLGKPNSWNSRIDAVKQFITKQNPDWLSLQYVSFGFQDKGLPFSLTRVLKQISGNNRKWHVMFHELWVGMNDEASFKLKVWGKVQKYLIFSLLRNLKPTKISTQANVYAWQLKRNDFSPSLLPLCSNIKNRNQKTINNKVDYISIAVFGSIFPNVPFDNFAKEISALQNIAAIKYKFLFIGRNGKELPVWTQICSDNKIEFEVLGELVESDISETLSNCHLGITTTPILLAQKSGVVAAYLEHNLNIICISLPWSIQDFSAHKNPTIFEYQKGNFRINLFEPIKERGSKYPVDLASDFIKLLNGSHKENIEIVN